MIVFCTTCKGRAQHLQETLPRNLADNADYADCKFVVLNYNSQDNLLDYLRSSHAAEIESGRLVVYSHFDAPVFRMAHAKNMAHRCGILEGGSDVLVNLDADNLTGPGFARYIHEKFQEPNIFLWSRMVKEGPDRLPRGISGRIAVSRHSFLNAGGYDEKFETWSPDDKDFNTRLRNLGYAAHEINKRYLSGVLHNDKMRFREYPHAETSQGEDQFHEVEFSTATVANFGKYGCGVVFRNFNNMAPVYLNPLPTRIFGIGMHKTGTTSLHEALKILGFDSVHWWSAHWAKAIYQEMTTGGRSLTLEKSYALCDLPITILYEQLDKAYPGSKFILTTRDDGSWLRSVEAHWNRETNAFRASWDHDPFTHRLHRLVYGRKAFDAEIFMARFRKHNADVLEYFRERSADLLVMNVDRKPGWDGLCRFLGKAVPAVAYPKAYQTPK
jgi:hypothetical protein